MYWSQILREKHTRTTKANRWNTSDDIPNQSVINATIIKSCETSYKIIPVKILHLKIQKIKNERNLQ